MSQEYILTLSVVCKNANTVVKVSEILSRAASGLVLEEISAHLTMSVMDEEVEGVEEK